MATEGEKKVGRPTKMTPEVVELLRRAYMIGATNAEACAYAEISERVLYVYLAENEEFQQKIDEWKLSPVLKAKTTIVDNLKDVKNAQWYLERRAKKEYGANVDITTDGDKLSPILVKFIGENDEARQQSS